MRPVDNQTDTHIHTHTRTHISDDARTHLIIYWLGDAMRCSIESTGGTSLDHNDSPGLKIG